MSRPSERPEVSESHAAAAAAFARRIDERDLPDLESLVLFGSTAREEADGLDSDVDFLAVVADDADRSALAAELREVAYDVMLEFGPVVEVHVVRRETLERRREHPFVRRALREGEVYV